MNGAKEGDTMRTLTTLTVMIGLLATGCAPLVSKFAFFPDETDANRHQPVPARVEERTVVTADDERLQCFLVKNPAATRLLIYFHGNAGNIYQRIPTLVKLSSMGLDVLGVGYRGFGKSSGRPSERGAYRDGTAALRYALDSLQYREEQIFVFGRSIGTTVATNVSMNRRLAGLILVTPLTTGRSYVKAHGLRTVSWLVGGAFDNLERSAEIVTRTLVIHGTRDEVIPFQMGKELYENIGAEKYFVEIVDGFHNDLEFVDPASYWGAIERFVNADLP